MRRGAAGITLIELVVVLAILGIVLVVAVPAMTGAAAPSPEERGAAQVMRALEAVRAEAVRTGEPARARIVEDGTAIEGPSGRWTLEADSRLEAAAPIEAGPASEIHFYPTGLASGGRWVLVSSDGRAVPIEVSVLDGAIHAGDGGGVDP